MHFLKICLLCWLIAPHTLYALRLEKVLKIGGGENPDYIFFRGGPISVDREGNIYASDLEELTIRKYDPQGHFLARAGRRGKGPQEFSSLTSLSIINDQLLAWDFQARRLFFLDKNLNFFKRAKTS